MEHGTSECWGQDLLPTSPGITPVQTPARSALKPKPGAGAAPAPAVPSCRTPCQSPSQQCPDSSSGKLDLFAISAVCEAVRLPTFISKYKGNLTVGAQFGSSIHEEPEGSGNRWGLTRDTFPVTLTPHTAQTPGVMEI